MHPFPPAVPNTLYCAPSLPPNHRLLPHAPPNTDVPERIEGMPLTNVRLVSIKLITLAELKLVSWCSVFLELSLGWDAPERRVGGRLACWEGCSAALTSARC